MGEPKRCSLLVGTHVAVIAGRLTFDSQQPPP